MRSQDRHGGGMSLGLMNRQRVAGYNAKLDLDLSCATHECREASPIRPLAERVVTSEPHTGWPGTLFIVSWRTVTSRKSISANWGCVRTHTRRRNARLHLCVHGSMFTGSYKLSTFPPCSRKPPLRSDSSSRGTPRRRSSSDAAA